MTPEWLTAGLRAAGFDGVVAAAAMQPVGTGQMADSARFTLDYASGTGPASVVVKMSPANVDARLIGSSGYLKEVAFYDEIASTTACRVPARYYAEISDDGALFSLMLEDLAPAEQGDQIAGCTVEQAAIAVENLAGLHGPRWNDPTLVGAADLELPDTDSIAFLGLLMEADTEEFIGRYADRMIAEDIDTVRAFAPRIGDWLEARSEPLGLVHGDYRLDNLLFGTADGGYPVATVDWQTVGLGVPVRDLSYFLGNSLSIADRQEHERALVECYHAALLEHGVTDYSFEQCFDDYRYGQFQGPMVSVLGAIHSTRTDRGDDMFMAMISRSGQAIRDLDSFGTLP
ncbi:MAG: phosphotransferase [Acidimicrobiales bacterium]|nr:phosphotransferase [Acidimicrobiales bacterium]